MALGNVTLSTKLQLLAAALDIVDHVRNGIALSPTFHRAYDAGLIYLSQHLEMKINIKREAELIALKLDGGLQVFKASLGKVYLPQDKGQWPDMGFIAKANQFRMIATH